MRRVWMATVVLLAATAMVLAGCGSTHTSGAPVGNTVAMDHANPGTNATTVRHTTVAPREKHNQPVARSTPQTSTQRPPTTDTHTQSTSDKRLTRRFACSNGIITNVATGCRFARRLADRYSAQNGNQYQSLGVTVDGGHVDCAMDATADATFGDVTCANPSTYWWLMFSEGLNGPQEPTFRAPESASTQAVCSYLYRQWQDSGETDQNAIQTYSRLGCE